VVAVGADRECAGLELAADAGIPSFVVRLRDYPDRAAWDSALTNAVAEHDPDLVISAGFLTLAGPEVARRVTGRFLSPHSSLLPAFPGIRGPQDALDYGAKLAGATLFLVDDGVDAGVIVAQVAVPFEDDDTVETLTGRLKVAERAQLIDAVGAMARGGWHVSGRRCVLT